MRGSAMYTIKHAAASPLLQIEDMQIEPVGESLHRLQLTVVSTGYLATNLTEMAIQIKAARPVEARLKLGDGASILSGRAKTELGHIPGFGKKKVEWVLQGSGELEVEVE